jgi:hypothetical protein
VPETRIKRLLSDLLPSLMALHAQGEICGDISLDTVGMDENARAHLVPELVVARSRRATRTPTPGFAPFELYTDSMEWPRGPWSDIYALCAVMHTLVIGSKPAPAPERRAEDTYEPLASLGLPKYSQDFLAVIDAGLAMAPADRPQTLADLAGMLGIAAPVETAPDPVIPAPASRAAPAAAAAAHQPARGRHPLLVLLLIVALIGAGVYAWFESGMGAPNALITRSEVVQPNPPAVHPLPPPSPPAPGAASAVPPSLPEVRTPQETAPQPPVAGSAPAQSDTPAQPAAPAEASGATSTPPAAAPAETPAVAEEAPKPKPVPVLVRLDIRPWGEVWINGVARGISPPVKELRLIPGKYQVVLRNADLPPYRMTLEVKAGKPAVISHVFQ